jgi:hypothetical protein
MFQTGQNMIWLNPQVNPRGNWQLCADTFKEIGSLSDEEVKRYIGEQPKAKFDEAEINNEWIRFLNGEDFDPPEGETALAMQHLEGHTKQKEEKYDKLSVEARPNFDAHLFKTMINAMKFMRNVKNEQIANELASRTIMSSPNQPQQPGQQPQQPIQPNQPGTGNAVAPGQMSGGMGEQ